MPKLSKSQKRAKAQKQKNRASATKAHIKNRERNLVKPTLDSLPNFIGCNNCDGIAPKSTFEILKTDNMKGIDLAFSGICEQCESLTIAMKGEPEACEALHKLMLTDRADLKASIQSLNTPQ